MKFNYKVSAVTSTAVILFTLCFCASVFAEPRMDQARLYQRIADDAATIKKLNSDKKAILKAFQHFQSRLLQVCQKGSTITAVGANGESVTFYCSKVSEA